MVVSMDYTLSLDDGEVVDSSEGRGPLEFIHGHGRIISGLESALFGMALGETKTVVVPPEDGYGVHDSDLYETVPRSAFPDNVDLKEGMGFRMRGAAGKIVVAYVDTIGEDEVTLNLNHPLAGKTLHFDVEISGIREASAEELDESCGSCGSCGGCGSGGCSGEHAEGGHGDGCSGGCCH